MKYKIIKISLSRVAHQNKNEVIKKILKSKYIFSNVKIIASSLN